MMTKLMFPLFFCFLGLLSIRRDNRLPFLPIRHSSRFLMEARTADMERGGRGKAESLNVIFSVDSCDDGFPQQFALDTENGILFHPMLEGIPFASGIVTGGFYGL